MTYTPIHFKVQELVDPEIYRARGARALELLNPYVLEDIDTLRDELGSITINDWLWGGKYKESGLRRHDTSTGAQWSMHKFGGAFDLKFKDVTVREAAELILSRAWKGITTIENPDATPTWLHIDGRNHRHVNAGILIVDP